MDKSQIMTIKEVAQYLKMNERTVYKLIQSGKIPAAKLGKQWRLNKDQLNELLGFQMSEMPNEDLKDLEKDHKEAVIKITPLLKKEKVIFNFYANSKSQAIQSLVNVISENDKLSASNSEKLLKAVMERERLCSTAIEEGVALPHPRDVVLKGLKKPLIAIGVSKHGMDLESIDGKPTHLILLIIAHRSDIHLRLMARLSRLLRDKVVRYKLSNLADFKEFKDLIKHAEEIIDKEATK